MYLMLIRCNVVWRTSSKTRERMWSTRDSDFCQLPRKCLPAGTAGRSRSYFFSLFLPRRNRSSVSERNELSRDKRERERERELSKGFSSAFPPCETRTLQVRLQFVTLNLLLVFTWIRRWNNKRMQRYDRNPVNESIQSIFNSISVQLFSVTRRVTRLVISYESFLWMILDFSVIWSRWV